MTYQISRTILTALVLFALPFAARAQGTNTAYGTHALNDPYLQGANNTAIGYDAVTSDTAGSDNTGTGAYTLANNTTGNQNTAFGNQTLQVNTTGDNNTAVGHVALQS